MSILKGNQFLDVKTSFSIFFVKKMMMQMMVLNLKTMKKNRTKTMWKVVTMKIVNMISSVPPTT